MKLAFCLLTHGNSDTVCAAGKILGRHGDHVLIHHDKRFLDGTSKDSLLKCCDWLHPAPYSANWGGFNIVRATLDALRYACNEIAADYFVLMSGTTVPLKSRPEIVDEISRIGADAFVSWFPLPHVHWGVRGGFERVEDYHVRDYYLPRTSKFNSVLSLGSRCFTAIVGRKRIDPALSMMGGSQWFIMSVDLARRIIREIESNWHRYAIFTTGLLADEMIFNTAIKTVTGGSGVHESNMLHLRWGANKRPESLSISELGKIGGDFLFARKIDLSNAENLEWVSRAFDGGHRRNAHP